MTVRRVLVVVLAGALLLAIAGVVVAARREPTPVKAALAVVDDDDRFTTALEASDAFAQVSGLLEAVRCNPDREEECARLYRAAAWTKVTAVLIVGCTRPAVFEARAGLGRYLRGGDALPPTPRCGTRRQASSS